MGRRGKKPDFEAIKAANPFTENLVVKVRKIESGWRQDHDEAWMPNEVELDNEPCFKTFCSRDTRLLRAGLSYRARQLWDWVMDTVESGDDVVWVDVARYMRECGLKDPKTYRSAVIELGLKRFIIGVPGEKHTYFINPSMGFKGSRVNKYPNNLEFV